jgi:hypothetical protein
MIVTMILFDAGGGAGVEGGVIRVSRGDHSSQFPVLSSQTDTKHSSGSLRRDRGKAQSVCVMWWGRREKLEPQGAQRSTEEAVGTERFGRASVFGW